jgi:hydroxypyruvate reductase
MQLRDRLVAIWEATVAGLSGERLVREALSVPGAAPAPRPGGRRTILALGKAAGAMSRGAVAALGPLPGVAVGLAEDPAPPSLSFVPGDHPVPGAGSLRGGEALLAAAGALGPADAALVLLSGGGSALAEAPSPGITLADLGATTRLLLGAGAPIAAINTVRRHLSRLKGGGLGAALGAGAVTVLAISDVHGDDPATLASGPLWPDPTTFAAAMAVLRDHGILSRVPAAVRSHLAAGAAGLRPETPKPGDERLARIETRVLAGPADLPRVAAAHAARLGFAAEASPRFLGGDVREVAAWWAVRAAELATAPGSAPRLLAAAAEPTVVLPPSPGVGGRARQLALLVARELAGKPLAFLAAGSDGRDGAAGAAGAAVDGGTLAAARAAGIDVDAAIDAADAGPALAALDLAVAERATGTNLADLNLLAAG